MRITQEINSIKEEGAESPARILHVRAVIETEIENPLIRISKKPNQAAFLFDPHLQKDGNPELRRFGRSATPFMLSSKEVDREEAMNVMTDAAIATISGPNRVLYLSGNPTKKLCATIVEITMESKTSFTSVFEERDIEDLYTGALWTPRITVSGVS